MTRNFHSSAFSEDGNKAFSLSTTTKRSLSQSSESSTSSCSSVVQEKVENVISNHDVLQASKVKISSFCDFEEVVSRMNH